MDCKGTIFFLFMQIIFLSMIFFLLIFLSFVFLSSIFILCLFSPLFSLSFSPLFFCCIYHYHFLTIPLSLRYHFLTICYFFYSDLR